MKAAKASRWPTALPGSRPSLASAGCAILVHVAVGAAVLTVVHLTVVPDVPDAQTVEMVFASARSDPADPVAPSSLPDAAVTPRPPEAQVSPETPPPPEIPAAAATIPPVPEPSPPPKPPDAPAPIVPPPTVPPPTVPPPTVPPPIVPLAPVPPPPVPLAPVPKVVLRAGPTPAPRSPQTLPAGQSHPPDAPASRPTSGPVNAEAPIAGDWQRSLAAWLAAHKTYPDEARRRNTEGSVVLRFTADRSGRVLDVVLVRSAGSSILDAAAESMLRNATLPPFTVGMSRDKVTVTIQIHYTLAN